MSMRKQIQLITYPDSLGGDLAHLHQLLTGSFAGLFGGVHILPPFPSTGDRGFAPKTYFEIEPLFGSWEDIQKIGKNQDLMVDLMINHISRHSDYFTDFFNKGRESAYADMFITVDKIWQNGIPDPDDVNKIFLRRPNHCFETITITKTGTTEKVWATFGKADWSEQIDLDVNSPVTRTFFRHVFSFMQQQNVNLLRLDAIAFVTKKAGTSCFFVEPEIYHFLDWVMQEAQLFHIQLLPEVHAHFSIQQKLAAHGFYVYNFVLPLLILHTLFHGSTEILQKHLQQCPDNQITMLDCHDGIPVQPDINDVVPIPAAKAVVDQCINRGANLSRIFSEKHRLEFDFDAHQINCTYFSALDKNADDYLITRAIQFFAPGIPQVYYVGLLAGENDDQAIVHQGDKRAINRHNYSMAEIEDALTKPVVQRLIRLIQFRNSHEAFQGSFQVEETDPHLLKLVRRKNKQFVVLTVDLESRQCEIEYSEKYGSVKKYSP